MEHGELAGEFIHKRKDVSERILWDTLLIILGEVDEQIKIKRERL